MNDRDAERPALGPVSRRSERIFVIVAQRGFAISRSRREIIEHFVARGWRVLIATADDDYARNLTDVGAELAPVPFVRGALAPAADIRASWTLVALLRRSRPSLIHAFHAKPLILTALAARCAGIYQPRMVATITGLGHVFITGGVLRSIASLGYRSTLPDYNAVIFQNSDDRELFTDGGWVRADQVRTIVGSGVDTSHFRPADRKTRPGVRVLMMGRLLWQKGVGEYLEAARRVRAEDPNVTFLLAGELDDRHPDAVPRSVIDAATREGMVEFLGFVDRPDELLREVDLCAFPSYREGCPRAVLEACASGVPTIGADVPGTREIVSHGESGVLVPVRDSLALASAILKLAGDAGMRNRMGVAARERALSEYAKEVVLRKHIELYAELITDDR